MINQTHSFDPAVAAKFGVDEAIVINHFTYFLNHHKANETNYFEGHYWTYDTADSLAQKMPYWSKNKIQKLLKRMEERHLLISGDFAPNRFQRPKYYRLGTAITGSQEADTLQPNGCFGESRAADSRDSRAADSSLPDLSTDQSPDLKKNNIKKSLIPKRYSKIDFSPLKLDEEQILIVINIREAKRAAITQHAIKLLSTQLDLARANGLTNEQIIDFWTDRGWNTFKYEWYENAVIKTPGLKKDYRQIAHGEFSGTPEGWNDGSQYNK